MFPAAENKDQLVLLETEVYGLVSGPAWWRVSFVKKFISLGYVMNRCDPCAMVLPGPSEKAKSRGIAILEMDDVLEGGDELHEKNMDALGKLVTFGKVKECYGAAEGFLFNGRKWRQDKDFHIYYDMNEYMKDRLKTVPLTSPTRCRSACGWRR